VKLLGHISNARTRALVPMANTNKTIPAIPHSCGSWESIEIVAVEEISILVDVVA
jgi:hypothetical protein